MKLEVFEALVKEAVENLPDYLLKKLDNVDIVVEIWPDAKILEDLRIKPRGLLFGLYQGTPPTKRTKGTIFPDKITIFAGPILAVSKTEEDVKKKISSVVKHEIAHHFGLKEASIRRTGH
jgi:predicted Zn-dependent protease with MMP-like domain